MNVAKLLTDTDNVPTSLAARLRLLRKLADNTDYVCHICFATGTMFQQGHDVRTCRPCALMLQLAALHTYPVWKAIPC